MMYEKYDTSIQMTVLISYLFSKFTMVSSIGLCVHIVRKSS